MSGQPIWLITGVMAAGKSTIAQQLAERLHPSVHLRGDTFRKSIINGRVDMSDNATEEALAQLRLRYTATRDVAVRFAESGFHVVVQDVIIGPVLEEVAALYAGHPLAVVVLCPRPDVVAAREAKRAKTGYSHFSVETLQAAFEQTPKLGYWLDNSDLSVNDTVAQILSSRGQALIDQA